MGKFRITVDQGKVQDAARDVKAALDSSVQKYSIVRAVSQLPTVVEAEVQSLSANEIVISQALQAAGVKVSKVEEMRG
jgi:hypothetical protein